MHARTHHRDIPFSSSSNRDVYPWYRINITSRPSVEDGIVLSHLPGDHVSTQSCVSF